MDSNTWNLGSIRSAGRMLVAALGLLGTLSFTGCGAGAGAPEQTIRYRFSGVLEERFGVIPPGTPFLGSFSYVRGQTAEPDRPLFGVYRSSSISVYFRAGTVTDMGPGKIRVHDGQHPTYDTFTLCSSNASGSLGGLQIDPLGILLELEDRTRTAWSGLALPGPELIMENFTSGNGTVLLLQSDRSVPSYTTRGTLIGLQGELLP